jgi:hypothetical protein
MKTILMELRYSSEPGKYERYSGLVDGINDIVGQIAQRFSLDILSVSHVIEASLQGQSRHTSITCTAVCSLNEHTREHIGKTLEAENQQPDANLYCFPDRHNKLSVRVAHINYN